jgi:hypothetical protein
MSLSEINKAAVETTLAEFDKLGRLAFLDQYGYGTATTYLLRHNGHFYDPKAVAGVANQHTTDGLPLKANEFDATQGYLCSVDYRELAEPLNRVDIPARTAVKEDGAAERLRAQLVA